MSLVDGGDTTLVHIVFVIKDSLKDPSLEIGSQSIPLQQGNQFPTVWKCSIDGDWLSGLVQTRQNRANLKASSTRLLFLSQTIEHSFTLQRKSHIFVMDKEDFTGFSRKSESIAVLVKFAVSEMAGESIRAGREFIKAITQEYSGFLQYLSKEQFHELVKLEVEPKERLINTILLSAVIPSFINNKFLALLRDCDIEDEALLEALSRNAAWMQCKQLVQHGLQKDDFSFLPLCLYYPKQLETIASTFVIGSKGNPSVSLLENLGFIQTRIPQDKEYSICRAIVSCASSVYDILIIASKATALIPLLESNDDFREFFKAQMRSKIEGGNACFLIETWQQVCKMEEIKILSIEILRTAIKPRPSVRNNDEASDLVNLLMFNELFTAEERTERLCLWLNDERISNEVVLRFTEIIDSLKPKLAHTLLDKLTKKGKLTLFHLIKCLRAFQPTNRELFSELDVESLIAKLWNAVIALPFDNSIQTFEREEFRCLLGEFLEMYQPALTRKFNSFSADLEHYFKILFDVNKGIAKERFDYSYATLEYCIIPSAESSDRYSDISIPSIVKHIGFWTCITKIANKDKIYSTSLLKKVRAVINKEYKAQIEGTYSVEQYLKKVKELQKNLSHIFEEFVENYANQQLDIIYQKIDHSTSSLGFVKQVLVSIGGSIREKYLQFVQQKLNEFPRTKVSELLSASYWGELWEWKEQLIKLSSLAQSASFMSTIVKNQQPNAFSNLNDLMRYLISMEKHLIEKWTHILNGTAVISDVYEIYYHIQNKQHEIQLIEKYMNKQLTHSAKENIAFLQQNFGFITDAQHILDLLELCNLSGQFKTLLEEYANTNFNNMLLSDFKKRTITITKNLTLQNFEVAHTIVECKDVFFFVKENCNEDMRNMINGVEEHSDNFIRESTVSDLIDVWSFLRALIQTSSSSETKLLNNLHKLLAMDKNKNIEAKLKNCSQNIHGLKRLHKNLSNRTEFTKEIIAHLLEDSITAINLGSSMCTIKMRYKNGKSIYGMEELNDLRSRCLLLANTDTRNETTAHSYRNFIELVDLLQSIQKKVMELFDVGYPVNMNSEFVSYQDLEEEKKHLDNMYEEWINVKTKYRDEFHILNVYHSQQIWMIEQHLSKLSRNISLEQKEENELLNLLRLINPGIIMEKITDQFDFSFSNEDKIEQRLTRILTFLSKISEPKVATGTINKLLPNGATVCCVDKRKIIPLLLTIFIGCHDTPSPLNTLVCYEDTSWSEVEAFLFRCRQSNSQLHCLLNVHKLNFYVKDSLIELIHKFEQKESQFLMLLITERGKDFLSEEMRSNVRDFKELDATTLKNFVSKIRPNVEFVISHINGIGKTEYIKEQSFELGKLPILFPVSGSLERKKLVNRLAEINFLKCSSLHIDISIINNDPDFIDFFLFEMLVIGKVSFGSTIVLLSSIPTFIEIANTVNNSLVNSIAVREFFKVSDLSSDMDRFIASEEILSPVQIVCQYLQRYDKNQLINNDIVFGRVGDKQSLNPIPNNECIRLIKRYLLNKDHALSSFSAVHVYLNVLANQLLMMSASIYFRVGSLEKMGASSSIRNELLLALINLTTEFSSSASTLNKIHVLNDDQQAMLEIFNGFLHWEDSNHLLVLFHNINSQTISAVYRDSSHVPDSVKNLLRSQHTKSTSQTYTLPNYSTLKRDELLEVLKKICLTSPLNNSEDDKDYALTPDNILKMILIITRVRARVPVVILGETGCGKTSLIKYLANVIGAVIITKDIHAGVTEEDIVSVVLEANTKAILENVNVWLFLDEINTCDSVGLISEVICNKTCNGKPLNRNLSIIAACNPYRLKLQHSKPTAGLEGKVKDKNVLAYRVNPLPQSMIAYVWDYGSLSQNDELRYIATIVDSMTNFSELKNLCTNLLFSSQEYIRQCEDKSSVSMRDIARFKKLYHWFYNSLKDKKPPTLEGKSQKTRKDLEKYYRVISSEASPNRKIRSIILALSHCYHSRLSTDTLRTHYREGVCQIFKNHNRHLTPDMFLDCLLQEQKDYLLRMELPEGTALNSSLLENVFVILVCILNKLPVFVVGKPGCSKSLSMQLINSNLRGFDSKDEMFRNLPQVYVVAYQGSESSTADGIEKVFQKAYKYLKDNDSNVIPVVLLDEVGLAEISKHNPLKVLHKLLEPEKQMVAVVGISNWCLDASKMNRAIHLSRPDASIQDLQQTGLSILECFVKEVTDTDKEWVLEVASAFHQYLLHQSYQNFHGLRDYYSLIKFLAKSGYNGLNNELLKVGIERNFGGLDTNEIIELIPRLASETPTPITDLVQLNLADKFARHLMVITNGDSALSLLENKAEVVFGSKFQDDQTEEYNYRVLSRIILCMESGIQLILKDLEQIYGSLYDMLNQNYTIVGKKKNCRIALGAFSNPMCHVHDDFKCVILIDEHNIDYADPPFLNRFEKQRLSYADIFDKDQIELKHTLIKWLKSVTTVEGTDFEIRDAIRSYNNETIDSLVVKHYRSEENVNEIIEACQQDLISLFNFEAILRLPFTNGANNHQVIQKLTQYHQTSPNSSILQYFTSCYDKSEMKLSVIYTFSNIHTDVLACLQHEFPNIETKSLVFKLVHFSCEKQVLQKLDAFFRDTVKQYLFIQCDAFYDSIHLLWLKYQINNLANSFGGTFSIDNKQIFLILHTQRQIFSEEKWIFNFLGKYDQIMIDNLDQSSSTFDLSQSDIIAVFKNNSDVILEKVIPWCFHTIRYPSNNPTLFQRVQDTIKNVSASPTLRKVFLELIVPNIPRSDETDWKKHVLCNRQRVTNSRSIHLAVFEYTCEIVRDILARYIYLIEKYSAFDCILENAGTSLSEEELGLWHKICSESSILNIQALPKPERDVYQYYEFIPQLRFPFSSALNQLLEEQRPQYEKLIIEFEENTFVELTDILRSTTFPKYKFLNHYLYGSEELLKKCLHDILKLQSARLGMSEDFDRFVYIFELLLRMETDSSLTSIYHLKHPMDVIVFMWRQSRRMHALNEMLNLVPCIFESSSVSTVELRDIVERSALYFFPSQKLLNEQYHNSIRDWHRITSQFILLTNRLDLEQVSLPKLVTLKLFNEFISTCIDNSEGKEIELSDTFYDLVKESTDSEDFTNDQIVLRLIGEIPFKLNSESVNKFLGYLILRCDPNAFNDFTAMMIQTIKQQQSAYQLLCYCETDILIYLQDRVDLFELVTNTNSLHEYELLSIIDSNMDSSLSCDISTYIGDLIHSNASFFIQQDQLQDGKILARLISTAENSKYRPFIRVMAVAFLKYFVDKIVDEFKFNCWRNDEKPSMDDYSFIATANDLLKSDCPENSLKHQLRIYFAKKVYTLFPTFKDLTQACMEDKPWGSTFSFLRKLQWPSPQHQGPNYLLVVDHHAEVLNALQQLMYQRNSTQIQTILSHLFVDSKWTYAILSVLVQHIFLKYSFERPFTSEETFTITWLNDYFSKNIKDQKLKAILLSITSNAFTNSPLRLHDQVDSESLEMIILIMHVVILIISYPKCNLADMILKPAQTVNMFIPSMPNSHVETVQYLISEEANEPLTRYTCNACGYMFFVGNCGNINEKSNCPSCGLGLDR